MSPKLKGGNRFEPENVAEEGAIRLSVLAVDHYVSAGNHFFPPTRKSIWLTRRFVEISGLTCAGIMCSVYNRNRVILPYLKYLAGSFFYTAALLAGRRSHYLGARRATLIGGMRLIRHELRLRLLPSSAPSSLRGNQSKTRRAHQNRLPLH